MQPVPNPDLGQAAGRGQGGQGGRQGGGGQGEQQEQRNPFGAGCGGGGGGFGGGRGGFGGGGGNPGPFVLPGLYNVALIVDGKTLETKPLRVMADKEVVLTEVERRRLYDMAMELHGLQRRANDVIASVVPLSRQLPEVRKQVESNAGLPADVKSQFEAFDKDLTALQAKLVPQGGGGRGGGGGGRGGADTSPMGRLNQAKNGMMGGMWPTQMTMTAYEDAKKGVPAAITEANALIAKAQAVSAALAKHSITLTVPPSTKAGTEPLK